MNWNRPIEWIKVKAYPEPIAVDKCCANMVRLVDGLSETETRWCCCNHGLKKDGSVEFRSSLPKTDLDHVGNVSPAPWQTKGDMRGWSVSVKCQCPKKVTEEASKHFNTNHEKYNVSRF